MPVIDNASGLTSVHPVRWTNELRVTLMENDRFGLLSWFRNSPAPSGQRARTGVLMNGEGAEAGQCDSIR